MIIDGLTGVLQTIAIWAHTMYRVLFQTSVSQRRGSAPHGARLRAERRVLVLPASGSRTKAAWGWFSGDGVIGAWQSFQQPTFQHITTYPNDCSAAHVFMLFLPSQVLKCRLLNWFSDHPMNIRPHLCYVFFVVSRIIIVCYVVRHLWRKSALDKWC